MNEIFITDEMLDAFTAPDRGTLSGPWRMDWRGERWMVACDGRRALMVRDDPERVLWTEGEDPETGAAGALLWQGRRVYPESAPDLAAVLNAQGDVLRTDVLAADTVMEGLTRTKDCGECAGSCKCALCDVGPCQSCNGSGETVSYAPVRMYEEDAMGLPGLWMEKILALPGEKVVCRKPGNYVTFTGPGGEYVVVGILRRVEEMGGSLPERTLPLRPYVTDLLVKEEMERGGQEG